MDTEVIAIHDCWNDFRDQRNRRPKIPRQTCANRESVDARLFCRSIFECSGLAHKPAIVEGISRHYVQLRAPGNTSGNDGLKVGREVPSEIVLSIYRHSESCV